MSTTKEVFSLPQCRGVIGVGELQMPFLVEGTVQYDGGYSVECAWIREITESELINLISTPSFCTIAPHYTLHQQTGTSLDRRLVFIEYVYSGHDVSFSS